MTGCNEGTTVERLNGRIGQVLNTAHCTSRDDLETLLRRSTYLYNQHIPQEALAHRTPIQALQHWQQQQPGLFLKRVANHTGLDIEDEAEDWVDRLRPDLPEYAQQIQARLDGARAAVERAAWKTICASSDPIGEWSTGYKPERTPEQDEDLQACIDDIENLEGYR